MLLHYTILTKNVAEEKPWLGGEGVTQEQAYHKISKHI